MEKEEIVKLAYGNAWNDVKDVISGGSWVHEDDLSYDMAGFKSSDIHFSEYSNEHWQPKSLKGIDENNGWTRTDEVLPSKKGYYYVCVNGEYNQGFRFYLTDKASDNSIDFFKENYSHWRFVGEFENPIY